MWWCQHGTCYLHFASSQVVDLSSDDLSTDGEAKPAFEGWECPKDQKTEGRWLVSPKLTGRDDDYQIVCAQGCTSGPPTSHMAVVAHSGFPIGPWESLPHNPLIHTYSADENWWSLGSTADDRWFIVYRGYQRGQQTLGRLRMEVPQRAIQDYEPRQQDGLSSGREWQELTSSFDISGYVQNKLIGISNSLAPHLPSVANVAPNSQVFFIDAPNVT